MGLKSAMDSATSNWKQKCVFACDVVRASTRQILRCVIEANGGAAFWSYAFRPTPSFSFALFLLSSHDGPVADKCYWYKLQAGGQGKNTTHSSKDWRCTARGGRRSLPSSRLELSCKLEPTPRNISWNSQKLDKAETLMCQLTVKPQALAVERYYAWLIFTV